MLYFLRQDCNIIVITLFSKLTKFCVHNVNTTGGMSERMITLVQMLEILKNTQFF